jgi:hypothetical protein
MALDETLIDSFLGYLLQREEVRLRRVRGESQQDAAPNDILRTVRLCCVHRHHDPTSVSVREQLSKLRALGGGGGVVAFAAAVLRGFGGSRPFSIEQYILFFILLSLQRLPGHWAGHNYLRKTAQRLVLLPLQEDRES